MNLSPNTRVQVSFALMRLTNLLISFFHRGQITFLEILLLNEMMWSIIELVSMLVLCKNSSLWRSCGPFMQMDYEAL
jgi:hypothetical protein